jgi:hypothetical protein
MARKTRKQMRKQRRRTLRRIPKKGGSDSQALTIPTNAIKVSVPVNSDNVVHKIA